jgi:hypothetical protein
LNAPGSYPNFGAWFVKKSEYYLNSKRKKYETNGILWKINQIKQRALRGSEFPYCLIIQNGFLG